ncbi:MarR family transcriptional regulator [Paenibacillus sp. JMULE4]|uniref:MarR family winged helix-turn-helix transcriptional regulator n=1 Tax=Paenibacillus TaxID=44249 RepID=UPI001576CB80|nr:MarR family transcriptional regulator [Paenibacillus sp. JMULE4]NTZ18138.1 MarR family transcriptional regulator [Paenibacillus sp. JMULE4]
MGLEGEIVKLLKDLIRSHNEILSKKMRDDSITPPQWMTLHQIYQQPKTIGQIVDAVQLSYSTVSGIIDRLERDGWIRRERDDRDRRIIWIYKTNKLQERMAGNTIFQETFYTELLSGLPEHELNMIVKSIRLLNKQIEMKVGEKT